MRLVPQFVLLLLACAAAAPGSADPAPPAGPSAARVLVERTPDGRVIRQAYPAGTVLVQATGPEGLGPAIAVVPGAPLDLIVQFAAPPLARARRLGLDLEASRAPGRAFTVDLPAIAAALPARAAGAAAGVRLRARFETAFNGAAVSGPPEMLERLRALPYVTRVFRDDSMHVTAEPAELALPSAPPRTRASGNGQGIRVAIVDSGIDYRHPALGGCFGPNCRVEGGFDFVNYDADPLDDLGHGTHVAGIVGADGAVVGVAPAVHFLAYKVVDEGGFGWESTIISGIERALDPDRDPATDDAADVINLSLGGLGDADSPLSQAVDEAVAAGVVCVVAAGNDGDYFGVGSPGAARRAITVGATDGGRAIAAFSSRGPAAPDWDIKPELAAPGVQIASTWLNGAYLSLSGTSMATPYVAGSVALLREAHPAWGPERIKAALMNGATPVDEPFTCGAGLVDVGATLAAGLAIVPGSLGFGRDLLPGGDWASVRALRLYNVSGAEQRVSLVVRRGSLPSGARLRIEPAEVTIAPADSALVAVTLEVAPGVPYPAQAPYAYAGEIVAQYDAGQVAVPCAFLQAGELTITSDHNALMMLHDDSRRWVFAALAGAPARRLTGPGAYGLIGLLDDAGQFRRIVREGIAVADRAAVELHVAEAIHTLRSVPVDQNGRILTSLLGFDYLYHRATGFGFITIFLTTDTETFSPMSDAYAFEWVRAINSPPQPTYTFLHYRQGIDASATFQNAPGDLRHVVGEYHFDPGVEQVAPIQYQCNGPAGLPRNGGILGIGSYSTLDPPVRSPFRLDTYFMAAPADVQFGSWFKEFDDSYIEATRVLQATPYMRALPGQPTRAYLLGEAQNPIHTLPAERFRCGFGPPIWLGRFDNQPDSLRLHVALGNGSWIFPLQGGAWRYHAGLPFELRRNDADYLSGSLDELGNWFGAPAFRQGLTPDAYALTVTDDRYFVDQRRGVARVTASFDTRAADPDPPYLTSLSVLADGVVTDTAGARTNNEIRLRVADDGGVVAVVARGRAEGDSRWAPLDLVRDGEDWRARLPDSTGYFSLEVEASDAAGNRFVYTMEPAVHLTSAYSIGRVTGRAVLEGRTAHLSWAVPTELQGPATVYRTENDTLWTALGAAGLAGGTFYFDDAGLELRRRYGYRLGVSLGGLERRTATLWLVVPGDELSLAGALRNPSLGAPIVAFVLPDARPATLEVVDVAGRLVLSRAVGGLGPGAHRLSLEGAAEWRPGIYWVRLRHSSGSITRKVAVMR